MSGGFSTLPFLSGKSRRDLLAETDGPMLQHGLKDMHGLKLTQPSRRADRPDRDGLAMRFEQFLEVQG